MTACSAWWSLLLSPFPLEARQASSASTLADLFAQQKWRKISFSIVHVLGVKS